MFTFHQSRTKTITLGSFEEKYYKSSFSTSGISGQEGSPEVLPDLILLGSVYLNEWKVTHNLTYIIRFENLDSDIGLPKTGYLILTVQK